MVVCEACAAPPSCDGQAVAVLVAVGPEGGCEVADHAVNRVTEGAGAVQKSKEEGSSGKLGTTRTQWAPCVREIRYS